MLWGYDINLTATHMAATALGMLSPTTQFEQLRIYRGLLGVYEGEAYVGSLEMLSPERRMRILPWPAPLGQMDTGKPEEPPKMGLVIMNPPFTVDRQRHNQFGPKEKTQINEREQKIFDQIDVSGVVDLTANSAGFAVLGEHLLRRDDAALALVMPAMIPTAPSGAGLRKFLADRFQIDTIVSSHDPERIFFSENTSIGEVLIVCRRRTDRANAQPTRFVNLSRNPSSAAEAATVVHALERNAPIDGSIHHVDAERINDGDWYASNFLSPFLTEAFFELRSPPPPHWYVCTTLQASDRTGGGLTRRFSVPTCRPTTTTARSGFTRPTLRKRCARSLTRISPSKPTNNKWPRDTGRFGVGS